MQSKKTTRKGTPGSQGVGPGRTRAEAPRPELERVFGLAAARAVLAQRPDDVRQIAHAPDARQAIAELLREAAKRRIAYREVPREELERIAGSLHHEGVCMQVNPRRAPSVSELAKALAPKRFVLALDGVDNPHNIGALLRTAGFFGAQAMLVSKERETRLSSAAVRVAEGAAELVPVCFVQELAEPLDRLRAEGAHIVGADAHAGKSHAALAWPEKTVLVLGSERLGLTAPVKKRCHEFVHIQGAQGVESLNVSVAAGILMATLSSRMRSQR
ncbi:MAG: 23S rRNA (guanosine(2251)-2'-O)-methyltransferase RlmB [Myxococcales bacterium]